MEQDRWVGGSPARFRALGRPGKGVPTLSQLNALDSKLPVLETCLKAYTAQSRKLLKMSVALA